MPDEVGVAVLVALHHQLSVEQNKPAEEDETSVHVQLVGEEREEREKEEEEEEE